MTVSYWDDGMVSQYLTSFTIYMQLTNFTAVKKSHDSVIKPREKSHDPVGKN